MRLVVVIAVVGFGSWLLTRIGKRSKNVAEDQYLQIQKQQESQKKEEARKQEEARKRREARELEYQPWRLENNALVNKFLEIAERKVSRLDDYGDENWDALPKELEIFLSKIAKADNDDIRPISGILFLRRKFINNRKGFVKYFQKAVSSKRDSELLEKYSFRRSNVESEFRSYHESRKGQTNSSDFADLSGVDFETYLANILKEHGFEDIRGTSSTGDQGGDLIAKRNGKTIVIQAKRYQGSVGNGAVQEVAGAIKFYGADEGWVITSGTFTSSAKALAQKNNVRLIDGHALRNRDFM